MRDIATDRKIPTALCRYTLPASSYWIGDPGYAISDEDWNQFCHDYQIDQLNEQSGSGPLVIFQTASGDGRYPGSDHNYYTVDSGTIAILPADMCQNTDEPALFGQFIEASEPFSVWKEPSGILGFSDITIQT